MMILMQAINKIKEISVSIEGKSLDEKKNLLEKCAATTLSSKLIGGEKDFFAKMVVDAVVAIKDDDRLNLIGIKKVFKPQPITIFITISLLLLFDIVFFSGSWRNNARLFPG